MHNCTYMHFQSVYMYLSALICMLCALCHLEPITEKQQQIHFFSLSCTGLKKMIISKFVGIRDRSETAVVTVTVVGMEVLFRLIPMTNRSGETICAIPLTPWMIRRKNPNFKSAFFGVHVFSYAVVLDVAWNYDQYYWSNTDGYRRNKEVG